MNINSAIIRGTKILKDKSICTASLDAEILMSFAINRDRNYILINSKQKLNDKKLNNYEELIHKRSKGKPIAYLTNKKFFWNSEFYVTNDTLIPRPDSELIVEKVLQIIKHKKKIKILFKLNNYFAKISLKNNSKKYTSAFACSFLIGFFIATIPSIYKHIENFRNQILVKEQKKIQIKNKEKKCKANNSDYIKFLNLGFPETANKKFNTCMLDK